MNNKFSLGDILFITTPLHTYEVIEVGGDYYKLLNQRGNATKFLKESAHEVFTKLGDL